MVTDATKKYRELMAYGLVAVAALVLIGSLSLLFKSGDDLGGDVGFAEKSALFGSLFESGLPVLSLVGAVILVTRLGELSANARIVVLAALGIGGVDLLFAVITFFAQFGAGSSFTYIAGVTGAGKIVGVFLGLAQLLFLAIAMGYFLTAFQSLPAPAATPAQQWGGGQAFGQYGPPNQQAWGQPDQGYPQGGQQAWGQPDQSSPQGGQQSWGQAGSSYGWAAPGDSQPPAWGQQSSAPGAPMPPQASRTGWGAPAAGGWGQPAGYAASPPEASSAPSPPPTAPSAGAAPERTGSTVWGAEPPGTETDLAGAEDQPVEEQQPPVSPESAADPQAEEHPDATATGEDDPSAGQGWWQHPQH